MMKSRLYNVLSPMFMGMLIFICSVYFSNSAFSQQKIVIYGDQGYPPYSYLENGVPKGVYVDILTKVFERIPNYSLNIEMVPWKRGMEKIKSGEYLALFPPYFSEERTEWMTFSAPIIPEEVFVFGTAETLARKENWPEDFYGTTVGMMHGYGIETMGGMDFARAVKEGKIILETAHKMEFNLKKLSAGRIDYYLNDRLMDISEYPKVKKGIPAKRNHGYLGFTKKHDLFSFLPDLEKEFNHTLAELKAAGEIDKIVQEWESKAKDRKQ